MKRSLFTPLRPVSPSARAALGVAFFVLFVALWAAATYGGWVRPLFLASPGRAVESAVALFVEFGFIADVGITIWRVVGGFVVAAAIAIPLGVAMGAYKPIEAF